MYDYAEIGIIIFVMSLVLLLVGFIFVYFGCEQFVPGLKSPTYYTGKIDNPILFYGGWVLMLLFRFILVTGLILPKIFLKINHKICIIWIFLDIIIANIEYDIMQNNQIEKTKQHI